MLGEHGSMLVMPAWGSQDRGHGSKLASKTSRTSRIRELWVCLRGPALMMEDRQRMTVEISLRLPRLHRQTHMCEHACAYTNMHTHLHTHKYVHTQACAHTYARMWPKPIFSHMHARTHTCMHVHTHTWKWKNKNVKKREEKEQKARKKCNPKVLNTVRGVWMNTFKWGWATAILRWFWLFCGELGDQKYEREGEERPAPRQLPRWRTTDSEQSNSGDREKQTASRLSLKTI